MSFLILCQRQAFFISYLVLNAYHVQRNISTALYASDIMRELVETPQVRTADLRLGWITW